MSGGRTASITAPFSGGEPDCDIFRLPWATRIGKGRTTASRRHPSPAGTVRADDGRTTTIETTVVIQ
ncbi:MAG: hypothetical protein R2851_00680 [Caldilineaceae bacterium]